MRQILISPLITEKMTNLTADKGIYGFMVSTFSNKIEIARAIENKFQVHVVAVRTVKHSGKVKTQFRKSGRYTGKTAATKKAYVTLKKGETIELFEQV